MAGCTVPDTYPIIPAGGANMHSTNYASNNNQGNIAGTSNWVNSMDPNNDIAGDTTAIADTVKAAAAAGAFNAKVIDLQNYMKLTRGFTIGDTGAGTAGNCTIGPVGSNYQTAAIAATGAIAADTPSFTFSNINFTFTRYEFGDSSHYDALNRALDSGHQFQIYFKNYQVFTGTSTNDKTQAIRITMSSQLSKHQIEPI